MNTSVTGTGVLAVVAVVAVGAGAFWVYKNRERFNPTNPDNLAHSGANAVGAALTGDKDFSLGVKVFDAVDALKSLVGRGEPNLADPVTVTYHRDAHGSGGLVDIGGADYYAP